MTRPARPFNPAPLYRLIRQQAWLILAVVIISAGFENIVTSSGFVITKNLFAGSVLAWLGQWVFSRISLSLSGAGRRRQIVHRFYIAHLVKWLLTLVGFILIYRYLNPLRPLAVISGFMLLQLSYMILLARQ